MRLLPHYVHTTDHLRHILVQCTIQYKFIQLIFLQNYTLANLCKALVHCEKIDRDPDPNPYFKMYRDPDSDHFSDRLCNI